MTEEVHLSLPLQYQQEIISDVLDSDGLVVVARGLGLPLIAANLLHALDVAGRNFVLVIGATDREIEWLGEGLASMDTSATKGLAVVNTETMSLERREMLYSGGGVFAVTSRILVVDMLSDVIATAKITGIVVLHAERVSATSTEAFILRLFRERNKAGFIKAFSDAPESFVTGFSPLTSMLRNMWLQRASLWPRFHVSVAQSLESTAKDVIELAVALTPAMAEMQTATLECVEACLRELRKTAASLLDFDDDDWAVENALHGSFDVRVRRQLDPVWHKVSAKSRELVGDLTTLRHVLDNLVTYDAVSFVKTLDVVASTASAWLFLDAANVLISAARRRIENVPEELPKWEQLAAVLDEITAEMLAANATRPVLVMCGDERTCLQLREYLCDRQNMLKRRRRAYAEWKRGFAVTRKQLFTRDRGKPAKKQPEPRSNPNKRRRMRGGGGGGGGGRPAELELEVVPEPEPDVRPPPGEPAGDDYEALGMDDVITIMPYDGDMDDRVLAELEPRYVVMYEPDAAFVRRLEVYRATTQNAVKIYLMYYAGSVEEQRYLSAVRKEKDAFSRLIRERANMAMVMAEPARPPSLAVVSTRVAGGGLARAQPERVVVDIREFRSALPSLLHAGGMAVVPCMLTVGDYVLTPEMVVERKSVADLVSSFRDGRLYAQCEAMAAHYDTVVLLIEFGHDKSFGFDAVDGDVQAKLVLLVLAFPRLRLIWSSSPYQTVEIFAALKDNNAQPDPARATQAGLDKHSAGLINQAGVDMVRRLPGVTAVNYRNIVYDVACFRDLCDMPEDAVAGLVGRESARKICAFLSKDVRVSDVACGLR